MAQTSSDNSKRGLLVGGAIVGLLLIGLIAGPIMSASSWKSSALDASNKVVDTVNKTNRDISTYGNKLQPTDDDYAKLIAAYDEQNKAVSDAKNNLKEVGGLSFIDVTGAYKKATDARGEIIAVYNELLGLNKVGLDRAKAEREVAKLFAAEDAMETPEAMQNTIKSIRDAASKINEFANTSNGTDTDKKTAAAFTKLADALQAMYDGSEAGDEAKVQEAATTLDDVSAELDSLSDQSTKDQEALQKKFDANIDKLNAAVKKLED